LPNVAGQVGLGTLALQGNHFSGSIPDSWGSGLTIASAMYLGDNLVEGPLPSPLATNRSTINVFDLRNNYFYGPMPNMSSFVLLTVFDISGANVTIDWCASNPEWRSTSVDLGITDLSALCNCLTYYDPPLDLTACSAEPAAMKKRQEVSIPPHFPPAYNCVTPPETPPAPGTSPTPHVPSAQPHSPVVANDCPPPSPGPSFHCVNGIWQSTGSVTQPTLTIPRPTIPGSTTTVVIGGNLTIDGDVTFDGFETQIVVNGCIFLGDNQVVVELTKEELEQLSKEGTLSKTLVTSLSGNGCIGSSDLSETGVSVTKGSGSKGCRKVKAKNSGSSKSSLHVIFAIDNSSCNMMIIIPCVIGGVLILVGVAIVVGLHLRKMRFAKPKQ
jgi:hypothetical protein